MKLGFFTACFHQDQLADIATWAARGGFAGLEIAAWPSDDSRPYTPAHIDANNFGQREADTLLSDLDRQGLEITSLGFYANNLHGNAQHRTANHEHLKKVIDAASLLGVSNVGTFLGRDIQRSVLDNTVLAEKLFPPLVEYAANASVSLMIENCVMEGWHPDGYPANIAYSPELWEWMFDSLGLYLNFDPSHLVWMGIDPSEAIRPYVDRVRHVQAKDIQPDLTARNNFGWPSRVFNRQNEWDTGWWRYRVPGRGVVDWKSIIDVLAEGGYNGAISVEHEDPVYSGSTQRILDGLEIARRTLEPLILD